MDREETDCFVRTVPDRCRVCFTCVRECPAKAIRIADGQAQVVAERCICCGKCQDFCLFGVYARDGRRVVAAEPDRCKDGCPACARLCPEGAILFPHYPDPVIAGG